MRETCYSNDKRRLIDYSLLLFRTLTTILLVVVPISVIKASISDILRKVTSLKNLLADGNLMSGSSTFERVMKPFLKMAKKKAEDLQVSRE